ncbi:MAG: glycosyltransferase family 4 protein [Planctomycetota bacterium]|jgi:glycosyltransferase involved in cell wall biosynthesis
MKIYQMMHFPLAGAGTGITVDNLAKSLTKRGHQVRALCSDHYVPNKPYPVEAVLFSNGENERFDLEFDFPVFASHCLSKGKKFGQLSELQRKTYFKAFKSRIENGISQFRPDIVHVHHGWVIASILAEFDVPYIISLHGTEYNAFKNYKDYQEAVLRGIHGAQIIVALTEEERTQAVEAYGLDTQGIIIIESGTDTDMFKPLEVDKESLLRGYSIEAVDRPIVFFGGRLTGQKGVDTLLHAASIYSNTDEKPITLIAGDGNLRDDLEKLAAELKLDSVYFLGAQNHEQMVKLFNVADVAAMPSVLEAFGLVSLEALACGTPVIAGNVGGFRKIVNEQVGYLMKPGDSDTLAEKITTFIKTGFKERVRDKAAAYIRQNFSWDKTVENTEKLYEKVLGRSGRRSDSGS